MKTKTSEAAGSYSTSTGFGRSGARVERIRCAPKCHPCPRCGVSGKRKTCLERRVRGLARGQEVVVVVTVGVYRARCRCSRTFRSDHPRVRKGWRYTREVREAVLDAIIRDRMPTHAVQVRLQEDYGLRISTGYVYDCLEWGFQNLDQEGYRAWTLANFSGVLCIDELHDSSRRKLLLATDPLNDFPVAFRIVEKCDQEAIDGFLDELKVLGFAPRVVVTDGSPLYKEALFERWAEVEHQLCVFHVLQGANVHILRAVRELARTLPKAKRYRRGRPKKRGRPRKPDTRRTFVMDHVHLVVKRKENWSLQDREAFQEMRRIVRELETVRCFVDRLYNLFRKDSTKEQARRRRRRLVNDPEFRANPHLARVLRMLSKEKFEKMITFLGWEEGERTNNHVERSNRSFRMMQKTRYKRRRGHTITRALWLTIHRRWKRHPLYGGPILEFPQKTPKAANPWEDAA